MSNQSSATQTPLVTREALAAFTQRLVEHFAPEQIILFGSQARGEARWDSDADLLVVMPFAGQPRDTVKALLAAGAAGSTAWRSRSLRGQVLEGETFGHGSRLIDGDATSMEPFWLPGCSGRPMAEGIDMEQSVGRRCAKQATLLGAALITKLRQQGLQA